MVATKQNNENVGNQLSPQEIAEFTAKQQRIEMYAKAAHDALQLVDLQNPPTKTYTVYSKESLRGYLRNPLSDTNQQNLRKLSQFLYVLSSQYRRIVSFFSSQVDLTAYTVIPNVSLTENNDEDKIMQNYEAVLKWIEVMNLQSQIFSILVTCWREDAFFGYIYYNEDDAWDKNNFVIIPIDGTYCKISSINYDGTLNFALDFSMFDNNSNKILLDYWDKEFTKMYNAYKADSKMRWQEVDPSKSVCFKINYDQTDRVIPPLASMFEAVIDLIDLQGIMSDKDVLSIYINCLLQKSQQLVEPKIQMILQLI